MALGVLVLAVLAAMGCVVVLAAVVAVVWVIVQERRPG